jgi:V8-like Glu-specific endopeptidase
LIIKGDDAEMAKKETILIMQQGIVPRCVVTSRKFMITGILCGLLAVSLVAGNKAVKAEVFGSDDRSRITRDEMLSYPWRAIGLVEAPGKRCTGTLVGRRLVMTAGHCVFINGTFEWAKFSPAYYGGETPYGSSYAERVFYYTTPWISSFGPAQDYVILVLTEPLGDTAGWMGYKNYSTNWTGDSFWTHVGYPGELEGGEYPYKAGDCSVHAWVDGSLILRQLLLLASHCDATPGHSGGPLFAWWNNGPCEVCLVGVYSASYDFRDYFSVSLAAGNLFFSGGLMTQLISDARDNWP